VTPRATDLFVYSVDGLKKNRVSFLNCSKEQVLLFAERENMGKKSISDYVATMKLKIGRCRE
jgi:hypothetical protein